MRGPSAPQFWGFLLLMPTSLATTTNFGVVTHADGRVLGGQPQRGASRPLTGSLGLGLEDCGLGRFGPFGPKKQSNSTSLQSFVTHDSTFRIPTAWGPRT